MLRGSPGSMGIPMFTASFLLPFLAVSVCVLASGVQAQPGNPLFLSQYLPQDPTEARKLSEVTALAGWNQQSFSGYFTTNETTFSNLFFWFFPAQSKQQNAPLLIWLQGGPGASSMYGLFTENGPFSVSSSSTLVPRSTSWNKNYHVMYVDNPVGSGFSFTTSTEGFATNEDHVARDLYSLLTQFYQVFPEYKANDLYVTGESYAGKYVPAFGYKIHQENQKGSSHVNLKGLSIGDGAMDPLIQFTGFSTLLYNLGLADEIEVLKIRQYEERIKEGIAAEDWKTAFLAFDEFLNADFYPYHSYFYNITGLTDYFNLLGPVYPPNPFVAYLEKSATRQAIHVGSVPYFDGNSTVEKYLLDDWMKSVASIIPTLLENYKVMMYNGQLDIILGPPLAENFYKTIQWSGRTEYLSAKKMIWRISSGDAPAGYVRRSKNFVQAVVRNAGHLVPQDQPEAAFDLITRFVENNWISS